MADLDVWLGSDSDDHSQFKYQTGGFHWMLSGGVQFVHYQSILFQPPQGTVRILDSLWSAAIHRVPWCRWGSSVLGDLVRLAGIVGLGFSPCFDTKCPTSLCPRFCARSLQSPFLP